MTARHDVHAGPAVTTRYLLANLVLGVFAIAVGGLFVAQGLDAVGITCDVLGVLYMHASVRRYSAK